MSWQEKAVAAFTARIFDETGDCPSRVAVEAALRAALPLIEVTPGMSEAAWIVDDASADGEAIHAALVKCAEEGRS